MIDVLGKSEYWPEQMGPRRKAREYALQMLFQWDITHDDIDQIVATFFRISLKNRRRSWILRASL